MHRSHMTRHMIWHVFRAAAVGRLKISCFFTRGERGNEFLRANIHGGAYSSRAFTHVNKICQKKTDFFMKFL